MNGSIEVEEHQKSNDTQKWAKDKSKQFCAFGLPGQYLRKVHAKFPNKLLHFFKEILKDTNKPTYIRSQWIA